ncbi:PRC-barrel domain-containing protein [Rhabdothermincola salaria]|uniref:PRC-barrel domain-containing protein n=1 Tax=Rhabdothermincola salaria TaxID=2903142 RepID=UPI001E347CEA|nr:PRC-barrel domain-containing protein [Rhabdothermincola salaria]MCD9623410.1 PRC-barrel domain-containing protein [Rhabdothermincola salaria]
MRWRRTLGIDVIDTSDASKVGSVDGIVVDVDSSRCVGVVTGAGVIGWDDSGGVGRDAVTISSRDLVREPSTDAEEAAVQGRSDPLGRRVLTEDGVALGKVADVSFDAETGEIRRLLLPDDDVQGNRLLGIGSYAVIVASPDREDADDLSGLTRDELYERARARDIEGRSGMTKQELLDALS